MHMKGVLGPFGHGRKRDGRTRRSEVRLGDCDKIRNRGVCRGVGARETDERYHPHAGGDLSTIRKDDRFALGSMNVDVGIANKARRKRDNVRPIRRGPVD